MGPAIESVAGSGSGDQVIGLVVGQGNVTTGGSSASGIVQFNTGDTRSGLNSDIVGISCSFRGNSSSTSSYSESGGGR